MKLFDVAILGASISGASLAACLGAEMVEVAIVDKERFPRRKACGEGLSNVGMDALKRMNLVSERSLETAVPYFDYRLHLGKRSFSMSSFRNRSLKGIGIERYHLDRSIVEKACVHGSVSPFFDRKVTHVDSTDTGYHVKFSNGEEIASRFLVVSDGAHSPSANLLKIPKVRKGPPLWGISFLLEGRFLEVPRDVVVLLEDGYEVNCTPVSDSRLNVTILTAREHVKKLQDRTTRAKLLAEVRRKCQFEGRAIGEPLQIGPVNPTRRSYFQGSTLLLGDAAETLDPVAGMGMTHGVLMAEIAADALLSILQGGVDCQSAMLQYAAKAESVSRPIRGFTRLTSSLLRSPARNFLLPLLASTPFPAAIRSGLDHSCEFGPKRFSLSGEFLSLVGV